LQPTGRCAKESLQQFGAKKSAPVEPTDFQELNNDQRREKVNTEQRFAAWQEAKARSNSYRGSLVWHQSAGENYLMRSYYDFANVRRQKVEGKRSPAIEKLKADWDVTREAADARQKHCENFWSARPPSTGRCV
jgi:hypothetical protein